MAKIEKIADSLIGECREIPNQVAEPFGIPFLFLAKCPVNLFT